MPTRTARRASNARYAGRVKSATDPGPTQVRADARPLPRNRRTGAFERRVAQGLGAVLDAGDGAVVVACSGGPDSIATLVAVARCLQPERVTAAHFDHRLRAAAEVARERELGREVASLLGAGFAEGRASREPGSRGEEAAREARYRWLARACGNAGARFCITGHTLDDQAETVLLRLARGTSATGVAGMAPESDWPVTARGARNLRLVRPLLGLTRVEVEGYLDALGLQGAEDPSNASLRYARNRVRREVMPALRQVNTRAVEHLARFAAAQREDDEVLAAFARTWLDQHSKTLAGGVEIDRAALRSAPPAVARRALWLAGRRLGITMEASHIAAILRSAGRGGTRVDLPLAYSEARATVLTLRARPTPTGAG